jgi:hypothetical protein
MDREIPNADIGHYEYRWSALERAWVLVGPAGVNPAARRLNAADAAASILHRTPYPDDRPRTPPQMRRRRERGRDYSGQLDKVITVAGAVCNTLA